MKYRFVITETSGDPETEEVIERGDWQEKFEHANDDGLSTTEQYADAAGSTDDFAHYVECEE